MKTSVDRLKWLIEFSENYQDADLRDGSGLQDWQRLKLGQEIREFIAGADETSNLVTEFAVRSDEPERVARRVSKTEISLRDIFDLRHVAGFALGAFTPKGVAIRKGPKAIKVSSNNEKFYYPFSPPTDACVTATAEFQVDRNRGLVAIGTLKELFTLRITLVLREAGTTNIAQCLECPRVFYRVRSKQKYCSKTCINRVSRREWLKKPANQIKESDWAHKRYVTRRKRAVGREKVRVQRRVKPQTEPKGFTQ